MADGVGNADVGEDDGAADGDSGEAVGEGSDDGAGGTEDGSCGASNTELSVANGWAFFVMVR